MNAGLKLIVVIILAIEVSFIQNLSLNLVVIGLSIVYLLAKRINYKAWLGLLFWPLIPAIGLFISQWFYGNGGFVLALAFATRIYVYVILGACFTFTTNVNELAFALEQSFHLPAKFAYGVLAAFNLIPKVIQQIKIIKTAALMRGIQVNFWSPKIYFKAIISALEWSQNLAESMESHGFVEDQKRTHYQVIKITHQDILKFTSLLIGFQLLVIGFSQAMF